MPTQERYFNNTKWQSPFTYKASGTTPDHRQEADNGRTVEMMRKRKREVPWHPLLSFSWKPSGQVQS